jgi:hypothetical protein
LVVASPPFFGHRVLAGNALDTILRTQAWIAS